MSDPNPTAANLIISCPDQIGIVRAVSDFLLKKKANISFLEEHIEDGFFFMRVEWETPIGTATPEEFDSAFEPLKNDYRMQAVFDWGLRKKRLGLFCSRELHCLADVLARHAIGELPAEIAFVISDHKDCAAFVERFGIPFYHIPVRKDSVEHEFVHLRILRQHPVDFLGFARYMRIVSREFIQNAGHPIINIHHSFLPAFLGAKPYDDAYERGVKLIGATAHYVTPELDQGPIIEQGITRINHSHKIDKVKLVGRECEKKVFAFALRKHLENKLVMFKNRVIVFE